VQGTEDSYLGRQVADYVAAHPGEGGFYPIYHGIDSLALRLLLAERAEHTIDAQYFLIHDDLVGNVFVNALLRAANRGVRVRFLLDDVLAQGLDPGLAILDSHENFEVRIFNPFAHRSARTLDVTNLGRITRRMHNKSFTIDNQFTLIGGRNIADEYFGARADQKFGDLDVLAIGPIVSEVSDMFDVYWNHRAAIPMPALAETPENAAEALANLESEVKKSLEGIETSKYAEAVKRSFDYYVGTDSSEFIWAPYDLVYDSPDKSSAETADESEFIMNQMSASIGEVKEDLFVVTPYFVLLDEDIEYFQRLRDRSVSVTVLTNSLASNNHTAVHGGYKPARKPLLEAGVDLYEQRANLDAPADKPLPKDAPVSTLHSKTFVVDAKSVFIGSFNWNQRSVNRDTEMGVIIHSPEIAGELVELVSAALPTYAFQVYMDDSNKLRWKCFEDGNEVIVKKEPQTGFWRRFNAGFLRMMPIKSQL
jgi:putative cardiolipin synthase